MTDIKKEIINISRCRKVCKTKASGSITVYLSLVLLLLLSLIFTIIESARIGTARIATERSVSTAMDSVLAEYYGPLWEEFHIFGLHTVSENGSTKEEAIASKIIDYMGYTLQPHKELDTSDGNVDLYQASIDSAKVDHETFLLDYQGKLIINEAVEYMKYRDIGVGLEQLLGKLSLLETPEKVSYVYEEKQKVEEQLVEIDRGILELMELLDGIKTSKKGIEIKKDGSLKTVSYFVKKICFGEVTKEEVGINQEEVFQALKDNYVNPIPEFTSIENDFSGIVAAQEQLMEYQSAMETDQAALSSAQAELNKLKGDTSKTRKERQKMIAVKNSIDTLCNRIEVNVMKKQEQSEIMMERTSTILASKQRISERIIGIEQVIRRALTVVEAIILRTQTAAPFIEQYEKVLNTYKDQFDGKISAGLMDDLKEMKKYVTLDDSGYDFQGMKEILEKDDRILQLVQGCLDQGENELLKGTYSQAREDFIKAQAQLVSYQTKGLVLDYHTLVLDRSEQENTISAVSNLLQKGITDLVIDPEKVSSNRLTENILPSDIAAISQGDVDYLSQMAELFKSTLLGGDDTDMGGLFGEFGSGVHIEELAGNMINVLTEHLLYQEYLKEHFQMYEANEDKQGKPSALEYEQEYLLVGKHTDQENIASVISRIVFLRTVLDFVSILGDSARRNEAGAAAAAMVGFTGLPVLVEITKVMILLAWSFAEALLDVSALMQGKTVPVIKKSITLQLPELFLINRSFLQSKASGIRATKELSMTYQDYLKIFLLMKDKGELAYRALDLMQEDIKLRYQDTDTSFCITDCVYGYEATVDYTIPPKFTGIGFVQKLLGSRSRGFRYQIKAACSY